MRPDDKVLGEVVVTGYNTIDKRKLTSSITSITKEDLDFKGALSVDQILEGKIAGLMTLTTSTTPGAGAASATAIYGTRAANGVTVVTTKSGEMGKTNVNYSFNAQAQRRPHYSDFNLMTSKQRIDVSREIMDKGLFFETMPERYGYEGAMMDYWDKSESRGFIHASHGTYLLQFQ